jgi:putative transposase
MRAVMTTRPASRSAQAMRRDLLLETLALRHQLGVLARSNQRFRPVDRLFWLFLRWLWPGWQEALVLIQPATIDRWHRKGIRQCWRRGSRHPGRPRIDSTCRDLIRRMAAENCLWGAPRIHGELLKLGITISERSVSRYLAWPSDQPVTNMADIPREHLRQQGVYLAGDVRGCGR